ncbi:putative RING-H2 finger protein ATL71 [Capsicum chinense]|nr:putative RING-H2 finger protein ATL71 [Capsicum chinense]
MEGSKLSPIDQVVEEKLNYYGYGLVFTTVMLTMIIVLVYAAYMCIQARARNNPIISTSTTTVDNRLIFIQQGLDEATLRSYPKLLYSQVKPHKEDFASSSGCSICLADFKDNDMLRLLPHCGHLFHLMCIDTWLRLHPTCPICRDSTSSSS